MLRQVVVANIVIGLAGCAAAPETPPATPWPTTAWAVSSPEAEGLDGAKLAALDAEFASGARGQITGMLVIRNGQVVFDKSYRHDFDALFAGRDPVRAPDRGAYRGAQPVMTADPAAATNNAGYNYRY